MEARALVVLHGEPTRLTRPHAGALLLSTDPRRALGRVDRGLALVPGCCREEPAYVYTADVPLRRGKKVAHVILPFTSYPRGIPQAFAWAGPPNLFVFAGGTVETRVCDVTKAYDVRALVAAAEDAFGALHVIVNNAGVAYAATLTDTSEDVWDATMETNVKGAFLGCKYAIPAIIRATTADA